VTAGGDTGAEERLLLALTPATRGAPAQRQLVAQLAAAADPQRTAAVFEAHGVLALYAARLRDLAPGPLADGLAERASATRLAAEAQTTVLEASLQEVLGLLAAAGVRAIPFKGPALARAAHDDAALRHSSDLDLLVGRAGLERAKEAMLGAGYTAPHDRLRPDGLPELHLSFAHPRPWGPEVEVHWRVHWADETHGDTVVERAEAGPDGLLRPAADDELAVLLLCYARDGFIGVRLAADVAGWWERNQERLSDGPALDAFTARHPATLPALAAAALVSDRIAGVPAERLLSPAGLRGAPRRAVALADPLASGDLQQLQAKMFVVEWLTVPRAERRGFWRRRIEYAATTRGIERWTHLPKVAARMVAARVGRPRRLQR